MSEPENPRQAVLDALIAERYGKSLWWKKDEPNPPLDLDDSAISTARRRWALSDVDIATNKSHRRRAG